MASTIYQWQRLWCQRDKPIRLNEQGYLYDPEGPFAETVNPYVKSFNAISALPCLVLLGEPGTGKSTVLQSHFADIQDQFRSGGDKALWFDLRQFQTDDRLHRTIFEHPDVLAWRQGTHHLSLFLDSLDECLLHIRMVAALIAHELTQLPAQRLTLRIACRSAEWPQSLEEALIRHWGEEHVGAHDLAPLRRRDVQVAAVTYGFPVDPFLAEIERVGAVPLASKPITLNFLLKTYRRNGRLPARQAQLYREGCRLLCEEYNQGRRDAGLLGTLDADQRLHVAERIAYLTIFANHATVWIGIDDADVPEQAVAVRTLVAEETLATVSGEPAIREALRTGLFNVRGVHELGWAHQTYAEFLAASYIVRQKMPPAQVMGLLQHADDPEGRLVPQLHETAAWLAGLDMDVFRRIMACDPEVLLRSDVATADAADRAALVSALLNLFDREQLLDSDRLLHRRYWKLTHPDLAGQLRPYIRDTQKGFLVRRVAIDIAEACVMQQLQDDLADVALDPEDLHHVRVQAAWALVRIGDSVTRARLRPLAFGNAGEDADDDLRGCGLLATWPEHLSAEDLFVALQEPQQDGYYGSYKSFLTSHCVQHLRPHDLPLALHWAGAQIPDQPGHSWRGLQSLSSDIMQPAWTHLDESGVLDAFAEVVLTRLERYIAIFGDDDLPYAKQSGTAADAFFQRWSADADRRRRVVTRLLPEMIATGREPLLLLHSRPPLLMEEDFDWLIAQLQNETAPELQAALSTIIARLFQVSNPEQFQTVYDLAQQSPFLAISLHHIFGPIDLNSAEADDLKAQDQRWQEIAQQREQRRERPPLDPPPAQRIQQHLDAFETGDLDAWWHLNLVLCFDTEGSPPHGELQVDLRMLPGWNAADEHTRARIVYAAQRYVLQAHDDPSKWRADDGITVYRPTFAAYRALLLLLYEDQGVLRSLPAEVWGRWAAIIVGYPVFGGTTDEAPHPVLTALAYLLAPQEMIAALIYEIDKNNRNGHSPSMLWKFEYCWDDALASALLGKARDSAMKAGSLNTILRALFEHQPSDELHAFTASLVVQPVPQDEDLHRKMLVAASVLLTMAPDAGWPTIWPVIQAEPAFGRELMEWLAHTDDRRAHIVAAYLNEDQLADLYIWLERQFPHHEDPGEDWASTEFHAVTPREDVAYWRDALLVALKNKGTPAAVQAIRRLQAELPELNWLRWSVLEAQAIARRETWTPLAPQELIALAHDPASRLVQSGEQLLDAIIESLERLQKMLRDETPAVFRLWNEAPSYRPKDEERLSDEVKMHLQADLEQRRIVVNREVVIRPTVPGFQGERLDLKVQAISHERDGQPRDTLTAIIEVKGCWNRELPHAMLTQLCDRYLKENTCQYGLYLVGWFNCAAWDNDDYRKSDAQSFAPSLEQARAQFEEQAQTLTGGGRTIRSFVLNAALPQNNAIQSGGNRTPQRRRKQRRQAQADRDDKV